MGYLGIWEVGDWTKKVIMGGIPDGEFLCNSNDRCSCHIVEILKKSPLLSYTYVSDMYTQYR